MNELFNTALTNISEELTVLSELTTIATALILGSIIAVTYRKTQDEEFYQRSLAVTLFMLPVILSAIILFVGSSIARAFSLAGTLSIIRFRSNPGDAKDIGFIFFDIAASGFTATVRCSRRCFVLRFWSLKRRMPSARNRSGGFCG